MKNYRIDLENVTDHNIEILDSYRRVTEKAARNCAKKLSLSKAFKDAKNYDNRGEQGKVRVWVWSDEGSNNEWEYGTHTMEYVDGKCTYETRG